MTTFEADACPGMITGATAALQRGAGRESALEWQPSRLAHSWRQWQHSKDIIFIVIYSTAIALFAHSMSIC